MITPQITIRNVDASINLKETIEKKIQKLSHFSDRINSCRVVVESPEGDKHHQASLYNVRVELTVPGRKQLVATHKNDKDPYIAVNRTFDAIIRQLEEHEHKRHGRTKTHAESLHGKVARLYPEEGYGFIEGVDGTEYYFSVTNVANTSFEQLQIGDAVAYTPEMLSEGWQAHHVTKGKNNNIDEIY